MQTLQRSNSTPLATSSATLTATPSPIPSKPSMLSPGSAFEVLVRLVEPLYIEELCSLPFYAARRHDRRFWSSYAASAVIEARTLAARSLAAYTSRVPTEDELRAMDHVQFAQWALSVAPAHLLQ
jgi:hypothetical protein